MVDMFDAAERRAWLYRLLAALTVLWSFWVALGSVPLFDLDEGAFSEATREMLLRQDYVTTYLNGALRFDKPILTYWLQLPFVRLLGPHALAFRLPSALAGSLWAGSLYLFVRKREGEASAFLSLLFMATSLQVIIISRAAIADALLNLFLALSLFSAYRYFEREKRQDILWTFLFSGLGALTKGPVAILIPGVVTLLFFWYEGKLRVWLRGISNPAGIALFLLVTVPWYALEYRAQGDAFLRGFFWKHNLQRFQAPLQQHAGGLFYYFPVVLFGLLPHSAYLLSALRRIPSIPSQWMGGRRRQNVPEHEPIAGADPLLRESDAIARFSWIWFGFVFLFFSFSGTKLPHYVIYGYTPLFWLMAREAERIKHDGWIFLWPFLFSLILFFTPETLRLLLPVVRDAYARIVMESALAWIGPAWRITMASATLLFLFWMLPASLPVPLVSSLSRVQKSWVAGILFVGLVHFLLMPMASYLLQEPVQEAALMARERGYNIVMWKVFNPSFMVTSGRLVEQRLPRAGDIVFTRTTFLRDFPRVQLLYQKNGLTLVRIE